MSSVIKLLHLIIFNDMSISDSIFQFVKLRNGTRQTWITILFQGNFNTSKCFNTSHTENMTLSTAKEMVQKMKRQHMAWEKIFA